MEDLISDLYEILNQEADCYGRTHRNHSGGTDGSYPNGGDELAENNHSKNRLIERIRAFEAERQRIALELAEVLALPAESVTLSNIAALIPPHGTTFRRCPYPVYGI